MSTTHDRPLVIFGTSPLAELTLFALLDDAGAEVAGFTVDRDRLEADSFNGLPVVAFDELARRFPAARHDMILPLGGTDRCRFRAERFAAAKRLGYRMPGFVSRNAVVSPRATMGENCLVFEGAVVQAMARLGDNCILRSHADVSHHAAVGDHCFLACGAVAGGSARLGDRVFLGLNATVRDGVSVAEGCLVGAGGCVVTDTEPEGIYAGVPAKRRDGAHDPWAKSASLSSRSRGK